LAVRDDIVLGTFSLGDLQEHRYSNPMVWEKDAVPHYVYARREHPALIISDRFDVDKSRFLNDIELMNRNLEQYKKDE
jgi:hypothetical protein